MTSEKPSEDSVADWLSQTFIETSPADTVYVADWHLKEVVGRPPIREYARNIWQRRHFIIADAQAKAFSVSRNMILGHLWLILQPAFDIGLYGLMFGVLLKTSKGIENFPAYLIVGVIFFSFMTKALSGSATLIRSNRNVIQAFPFPRASLAISLQVRNSIDSTPTIITTLLAIPLVSGIGVISWTWLLLFPLLALQILFCLGILFIFGRICHSIPDIQLLIKLFSRLWFYTSGIFFSIDRFINYPTIQTVMKLNPAYRFLEAFRDCLIYQAIPQTETWIHLLGWSLGIAIFGFIFFWRKEVEYGRKEQ